MNSAQLSDEPLISLIIPVYNTDKYLKQCLESALAQTYKNLEILIIDDGSTDGSGSICDEFAANDNVTVFHTKNSGLAAARNYGLDNMSEKSEYVAFLDSDDWMETNALQVLHKMADDYGVDIVACQYYKEYRNKSVSFTLPRQIVVYAGDQIVDNYIHGKGIANVMWNKLYKKELIPFLKNPTNREFEDVAATYTILKQAKSLAIIPDALIHYRIRNNSLSRNHSMKNLTDYWNAYYERYISLDGEYFQYKDDLVGSCINAITRMWVFYAKCNPVERRHGETIIKQMMQFASDHRKDVIHKSDFSKLQKITCIMAMSRNWVLMYLLYCVYCCSRFLRKDMMFE